MDHPLHPESVHCRLTASAAQIEGLRCQLVLQEGEASPYASRATGNHLLDDLLGAEEVRVARYDSSLDDEIECQAEALRLAGRKPYAIPIGGSNGLGTLGYVACGLEIQSQMNQMGVTFSHIVCASGSGSRKPVSSRRFSETGVTSRSWESTSVGKELLKRQKFLGWSGLLRAY